MRSFARELRIWAGLNHPNVIPCLGFAVDKSSPILISEWMDNGNVIQHLERNTGISKMEMVSPCFTILLSNCF